MRQTLKLFNEAFDTIKDKTTDTGAAAQAAATLVLAERLSDIIDLRVEFDGRLGLDVSLDDEVDVNVNND